MKKVSYVSTIVSLIYTQFYTHSDIAFVVNVSGRYLSDPSLSN